MFLLCVHAHEFFFLVQVFIFALVCFSFCCGQVCFSFLHPTLKTVSCSWSLWAMNALLEFVWVFAFCPYVLVLCFMHGADPPLGLRVSTSVIDLLVFACVEVCVACFGASSPLNSPVFASSPLNSPVFATTPRS